MFFKVSWTQDGSPREQICDGKMASKLMYELEIRKGIKANFKVAT